MNDNLILLTDSYKLSHWKQYPPGTETVHSYFESRGGEFPTTTFFGLQYFLEKYLKRLAIVPHDIKEAQGFANSHFGRDDCFNFEGWWHIWKAHDGKLPIRIRAVPEGMTVPVSNVLMTVENTDPKCWWLTNYVETLLVQTWYPTTVATLSRAIKQLILSELEATGDPSLIDFKLHDFGFRGVSSPESAAIGGAAHLVNFKGSDTIAGIVMLKEYYGAPMAGFSIPAAEHSTITSWGPLHEKDAYDNMITQFPTGFVAVVSDSYDIHAACRLWGGALKDRVLERDGVLVVRPDSGDPADTVLSVVRSLASSFGSTTNSKGYNMLNPKVRVIQGDGVDHASIGTILKRLRLDGWSADNIAFGMGGALLQKLNRDTCKFAFKCSHVSGSYGSRNVRKDPVGDHSKASKGGRLKLVKHNGSYLTVNQDWTGGEQDMLQTVFENGVVTKRYGLAEIRERARPL